MKKLLTLLLALMLLTALVTGCSSGKEDRAEADAPDGSAAVESEPAEDPEPAVESKPAEEPEPAVESEPAEEPMTVTDSHNSIAVTKITFTQLNEGTCLVPLQEIGFIINGVLNADMQIKANPDNLLSFVFEYTLSAPVSDEVLVVVTENGSELMRYSETVSLGEAGDNQFVASVVLPHPASGSYTLAFYVGGYCLAEESLFV